MERIVERVQFPERPKQLIRVAAYARVSSGKDEMLHSLSAQISYYNELIHRNHSSVKNCIVNSAMIAHTSDAVAIFRLATVPFNLLKSSGLFGPEVLFS